ncbi:FdrA family protein [Alkaliphilus metalliredigens QYMF]|uniref:FdrA family protein n=1 Tax=Alkaliphilus metalliredigens (strain QYMF) TaxID=293826 RepID=A6TL44_ALKMQ|nr:acyl-CoA synthetase FdrA [Alkaliphilus metalliredigens]ABR46912.1 FdrA family protein [Alkaliphilus metalliredigens QYMF]
MELKYAIRKNTYYDSVTLMLITKEVKKLPGIQEVLVGMGTELNKELASHLSLSNKEIQGLNPNDFFVTALASSDLSMEAVLKEVDTLLTKKKTQGDGDYRPPTLGAALKYQLDANLVLVSIPGEYAFDEVEKALHQDIHVMLFSDQMSMADERRLKEIAKERQLLMMGPDCGTAIINQVPLAFANVVRKGNIGIVGASGTGIQEVSILIHRLGEGVSQVIGTGGRDLKKEIGGIMMQQGIEALQNDPETGVIVLISKPPDEEVAERVLALIAHSEKPVVVNFIGGHLNLIEKYGRTPCTTLEDAAQKAVALLKGQAPRDFNGFTLSQERVSKMVCNEVKVFHHQQSYIRGLYTGGTLANETIKLLSEELGGIYSNSPLRPEYQLLNVEESFQHTCLDLGEDGFTRGKPHPMIDPSTRLQRFVKEANDEEVAMILMDFVLGYGSHEDPVGEMLPVIIEEKRRLNQRGRHLCVIASICGTEEDPQDLKKSQQRLEEAGVLVMPSNAQAARLASLIMKNQNLRRENHV